MTNLGEPTKEEYEQAVRVGKVESPRYKQQLLDELYTAMVDLGCYNEVAESKRINEVIQTMSKARDYIKEVNK